MDNNVVNSLWISDTIGPIQEICYNSYHAKGHQFHLYTYVKINNLPKNVVVMDANEIISKEKIFKDFRNSYATFSDWFRIKLLYERGGWWVDSDTVCIKKFDIVDEYAFATEIVDDRNNIAICNAVIKMPAHSQIGKEILSSILITLNSNDYSSIKWTEIGGQLLGKYIKKFELTAYILDPEVFCPINYFHFKSFLFNDNFRVPRATHAIHLWNKMWEWGEIDPNSVFHKNSYFERLKAKYLSK